MAQNNFRVQVHYDGNIYSDVNVRVVFQNTNMQIFKISHNSNFSHLRERIETKIQQRISDIYYRYPCFNEGDNSVTYTTTKIEDDNDVNLMFRCHTSYNVSNIIELYVCIVEQNEAPQTVYPTQESQAHQWFAKNKAIASIYGNWETSYNDLPQWLLVMKTFVPGTVIELEILPVWSNEGTQIGGTRIFHRLFWAFRPCIKGFAFCKPVVQVDGTWLYGKYRGTLLLAVAQDGNRNIFPIAFALVEGETGEAWSFFLRNLRRHVTSQPNLCLISDKHKSIISAYNNPDNGWQYPPSSHVFCIRHLAQNFMREIRDNELREKVTSMGYALNESTYEYYRREVRKANIHAFNWLEQIPRDKWTRAFDEGKRWGHMTTNLAESTNSVLKATRKVKSTYYRLGTLFGKTGHEWTKSLGYGQVYTDNCMKDIEIEALKSNSHKVMQFDRQRFCFLVQETVTYNDGRPATHYNVDLRNQTYECGRFQTFHVPCSHAITACSSIRQDYTVHIADVFKVVNVFKVYEESFIGVPTDTTWPQYEGDTLCHNDNMRRKKKGRPNSSRIRTEMNNIEKEKRRRDICREIGHMRRKCPNRAGPSS